MKRAAKRLTKVRQHPRRPRSTGAPANDVRLRLTAAIDRMPRRDRHVLNLILVEGLNELEAAQALGVEAPMVHRGYVALLRKLQRVADATTARASGRTRASKRTTRLRRAS